MESSSQTSPARLRRQVSYGSFDDVIRDAESLLTLPHETLGNWSFGQILQHLADSVDSSFDGFDFRMNVFIRVFGTLFLKKELSSDPSLLGSNCPNEREALYLMVTLLRLTDSIISNERWPALIKKIRPQVIRRLAI